jgi:diaminohydroxyphosphoribosylaminopyrimidine deaminase/5-amino-6-(5-phosphoribosylamino)uracil reductase
MARCLTLAARARGATSPNPLVGAVLVRDGKVIGEACHRRAGQAHAEAQILERVGDAARGATLYANVEPCAHHGRTPPCAAAIVDPDPRVDGRGFEKLLKAGIEVRVGVLSSRAVRLNDAYLTFKRLGRPMFVAKAALSADARMATREGDSQWITGEAARRHAQRLRAASDAVIVGVGTVLADDPRLTARSGGGPGPRWRVVVDSSLRTPPGARLLESEGPPVLLLTTDAADERARQELEARGATVVCVDAGGDGRVDLQSAAAELARRDVVQAMVEGGSRFLTGAFEAGIIDKVAFYYAPLLIGGDRALPLWGGEGADLLAAASRIHDVRRRRLEQDWLIEGYLHPPQARTSLAAGGESR